MVHRSDVIVTGVGLALLAASVGLAVHAHAVGARAGVTTLGAVPIADPPVTQVRLVRPGQFALLSMGDTVRVAFANGGAVQLTGLGPAFPSPSPDTAPPTSGPGTMQVAITGQAGVVTLDARQFVGTNELGQAVRLHATAPTRVTVRPGQHAVLSLEGVFITGDGALSYLPANRPAVTWDFSVELD